MAETNLSGAPDTQENKFSRPELEPSPTADPIEVSVPEADGETVIWDENNTLVHPEAKRLAEEEQRRVLGLDGDEESAKLKMADPAVIKLSQQRPSQTADPLTNPRPVTAPYTMPGFLGVGYGPQAEVDKVIMDAARGENIDNAPLSNVETIDRTKHTDADIMLPSSPSLPEGAPAPGPQTPMAPPADIPAFPARDEGDATETRETPPKAKRK